MKKYEKYKDSGVDWIGEIPSHWTIQRISWLFDIIGSGTTPKSDDDTLYSENGQSWLQTGDLTDGYVNETSKRVSEKALKSTSLTVYPKGSLVVALYGATIGKLGILNIDCATNQACCVMNGSRKIDTKMAFYLLMASKPSLIAKSAGGGQPNISQDIISHHQLPVPTIGEQQVIVTYLDHKVSQIDKSVATINTEIDELKAYRQSVISEAVTKGLNPSAKMKNSGVEWIGEIPEDWVVLPLKRLLLFPLMYGANEAATEDNRNGVRYIRITDIDESGKLKDETFKSLNIEKAKDYILEQGDILFARSGATVGKTYLYNERYKACFAGYLIKASCDREIISPKYLFKYTQSNTYNNWINSMFAQSTIQNIGADKYYCLPIILPPLSEQQAIATYLDAKTSRIDNSIKGLEAQRDDLNALKQSIISEAVTGKIDIRDWKPNNA